jgi:hypothetical protein
MTSWLLAMQTTLLLLPLLPSSLIATFTSNLPAPPPLTESEARYAAEHMPDSQDTILDTQDLYPNVLSTEGRARPPRVSFSAESVARAVPPDSQELILASQQFVAAARAPTAYW